MEQEGVLISIEVTSDSSPEREGSGNISRGCSGFLEAEVLVIKTSQMVNAVNW